ncbi:MAG: O-antigen ligase family protein [Candidatus Kapaibacterium sp.]
MIIIGLIVFGSVLIFCGLKDPREFSNKVCYMFTYTGFLFSLIGIFNYLLNPATRSSSLFGDRVFDAEFVVSTISFLLITTMLLKSHNGKIRNLLFLANLFPLIYIIILRTRAGWLATGIIFITIVLFSLLYFIHINGKFLLLRIGALIIISICLAILIPVDRKYERADLSKTLGSIFENDYYSNKVRIDYWNNSLKIFSEYPISGIGRGKWAGIYPYYSGKSYTDENVDMNSAINPHNDYIEVLTEYGIFGFIIFTGFIFTGLYFLFKKSKREINYLPFFLSALGVCIMMFFSFTKDNFWVMIVFGVCMGIGYSTNYKLVIKRYEFLNRNKLSLKKALLIIGILMFTTGIWFKIMAELNEKEYLEAMKLKSQNKYEEMLTKLDGVSDFYYPVDMSKIPVDYYRGVGYFELKQYDKALEKFKSARERMKYYPTIMNNEAAALYMTGNYEEAKKRYNEIRDIFPNYIEPRINLLAFYTNQKRYNEARELISEIESKTYDSRYVKNYSVFLEIKDYFNRNNIQ